ncbi:lyase family protein [Ramlibacter henchirensis]|uniref:lyase family protein n=1 Tax=Ramlibacter henchirensis TaxID=204072 RepID=UPI0010765D5C|nr:lyase family protein [Ramlibacter henchirensis]
MTHPYQASAMIGVLDHRYYGRDPAAAARIAPYLSEDGFFQAMLKVEVALAEGLAARGLCERSVADEVRAAAAQVQPAEVHAEQERIRHPVMSLVNCLKRRVCDTARPFVHLTATTNDIVCSADAYRYREFTRHVLLPCLIELQSTLLRRAVEERDTLQIGRTHGQYAEPITFGWSLAHFASRLGRAIRQVHAAAEDLRGKMAGAVGAYNASSLFFDDPLSFEREVLARLGLKPSPLPTQIVEAEYLVDYTHALVSAFGIVANIADDMRNLHRSELGEVEEHFTADHVGSSTMPHKRNPSRFEAVKSLWKVFMPRMATVYMDQVSEHQRDLTNFESTFFVAEVAAGLYFAADLLGKTMATMVVRRDLMRRNFDDAAGAIVAEPAQLLLSVSGHRDGHETVRRLSRQALAEGRNLADLLFADPTIAERLRGLDERRLAILRDPSHYTGICSPRTAELCAELERDLARLKSTLADTQPH